MSMPNFFSIRFENKRKIWFCFISWDFQLCSQMKIFSQFLFNSKNWTFYKISNWVKSFNFTTNCCFYFTRSNLLSVNVYICFRLCIGHHFVNDKIHKYQNYRIIILTVILIVIFFVLRSKKSQNLFTANKACININTLYS